MILKGKASIEVPKLTQPELVDSYLNDVFKNCRHTITFETPDPNGTVPKIVCKICGENVPHVDFRKQGVK